MVNVASLQTPTVMAGMNYVFQSINDAFIPFKPMGRTFMSYHDRDYLREEIVLEIDSLNQKFATSLNHSDIRAWGYEKLYRAVGDGLYKAIMRREILDVPDNIHLSEN